MDQPKRLSYKKIIIGLLFMCAVGAGVLYYVSVSHSPIYEFDEKRDTQPILKLFHENWYWLVASSDYSPEFAFKYRAPSQDPRYLGKLRVKVLREKNTFIGFVAYYMKTETEGKVLFLAVKTAARGKRYGQQLLQYALDDLINNMGAKIIKLVTRTNNLRAQKLYNRAGFKETSRDDEGFVYLKYVP